MDETLHRVAARLSRTAGRVATAAQGGVSGLAARVATATAPRPAPAPGGGPEPEATTELYPTGHFYSAVPSREHLVRYHDLIVHPSRLEVPGVDLRLAEQRALLDELEPLLADVPFEDFAGDGYPWRYHFHNDFFGFTDGLFLHLVVRHLRPKRVIEVGSGYSSACLLDTVEGFLDGQAELTFIEPYDDRLRGLLREGDATRVQIRNEEVQHVPLDVYRALGPGDLLLIDTTHTVKAAGDVNWLFFEVLPVLAPGVWVHVHDIFAGFEYPWSWLLEGRAWAEAYLLRAFLQYNSAFEVVLWPNLVLGHDTESRADRFPHVHNRGASIYLRRTA